jgi:hypothetical protein
VSRGGIRQCWLARDCKVCTRFLPSRDTIKLHPDVPGWLVGCRSPPVPPPPPLPCHAQPPLRTAPPVLSGLSVMISATPTCRDYGV